MDMIRGRTLPEVRRYDFWKLLIAALLFVNALFICGRPAPVADAPKVAAGASGNPEHNHELAKGRAEEVAAILKHAGVADVQIELRKPVQELGSSDPAKARRVEVGPAQ